MQAQELYLPKPGVMVSLSPPVNPPVLKGVKVYADNPFKFDFILDKGDDTSVIASEAKQSLTDGHPEAKPKDLKGPKDPSVASLPQDDELKHEANRLIKYFLASITVPEDDLWVNLSPYEKDRIIPDAFGKTEMGRDLLAQDYLLKQVTASLIYPEERIGKEFWSRVYKQTQEKFGTTNIPVNTFNKVWIVPEKAVVYEHMGSLPLGGEGKGGGQAVAYVVESRLKVMLEQDYLALDKNIPLPLWEGLGEGDIKSRTNALASQIVKDIVLPQLEREVNEGKNFAQLRQVYNSLILAAWYKQKIKNSILAKIYADKNKVAGVEYNSSVIARSEATKQSFNKIASDKQKASPRNDDVEGIYRQYIAAFKKGVFNYIKEDSVIARSPKGDEALPAGRQESLTIPRKYFSGGVSLAMTVSNNNSTNLHTDSAMSIVTSMDASQPQDRAMVLTVNVDPAVLITPDATAPSAAMTAEYPSQPMFLKSIRRKVTHGETAQFILRPGQEKLLTVTEIPPSVPGVIGKTMVFRVSRDKEGAVTYSFTDDGKTVKGEIGDGKPSQRAGDFRISFSMGYVYLARLVHKDKELSDQGANITESHVLSLPMNGAIAFKASMLLWGKEQGVPEKQIVVKGYLGRDEKGPWVLDNDLYGKTYLGKEKDSQIYSFDIKERHGDSFFVYVRFIDEGHVAVGMMLSRADRDRKQTRDMELQVANKERDELERSWKTKFKAALDSKDLGKALEILVDVKHWLLWGKEQEEALGQWRQAARGAQDHQGQGQGLTRKFLGKDYYGLLGVDPKASGEDIRKAYLRQVKEWHPDRRGKTEAEKEEATRKTQQLNEAYEALFSDQRKAYDEYRASLAQPSAAMTADPQGSLLEQMERWTDKEWAKALKSQEPVGEALPIKNEALRRDRQWRQNRLSATQAKLDQEPSTWPQALEARFNWTYSLLRFGDYSDNETLGIPEEMPEEQARRQKIATTLYLESFAYTPNGPQEDEEEAPAWNWYASDPETARSIGAYRMSLNMAVSVDSLDALIEELKARSIRAKFKVISIRPDHKVMAARHDTVTLYFPTPPTSEEKSAIGTVAERFKRRWKTEGRFYGEFVSAHVSSGSEIKSAHVEKFYGDLSGIHPRLGEWFKGKFYGENKGRWGMSEGEMEALKDIVKAFGARVVYDPLDGFRFLSRGQWQAGNIRHKFMNKMVPVLTFVGLRAESKAEGALQEEIKWKDLTDKLQKNLSAETLSDWPDMRQGMFQAFWETVSGAAMSQEGPLEDAVWGMAAEFFTRDDIEETLHVSKRKEGGKIVLRASFVPLWAEKATTLEEGNAPALKREHLFEGFEGYVGLAREKGWDIAVREENRGLVFTIGPSAAMVSGLNRREWLREAVATVAAVATSGVLPTQAVQVALSDDEKYEANLKKMILMGSQRGWDRFMEITRLENLRQRVINDDYRLRSFALALSGLDEGRYRLLVEVMMFKERPMGHKEFEKNDNYIKALAMRFQDEKGTAQDIKDRMDLFGELFAAGKNNPVARSNPHVLDLIWDQLSQDKRKVLREYLDGFPEVFKPENVNRHRVDKDALKKIGEEILNMEALSSMRDPNAKGIDAWNNPKAIDQLKKYLFRILTAFSLYAPVDERFMVDAKAHILTARFDDESGGIGADYTMSIGYRIAGTRIVRGFVGVLAHEFGHNLHPLGMVSSNTVVGEFVGDVYAHYFMEQIFGGSAEEAYTDFIRTMEAVAKRRLFLSRVSSLFKGVPSSFKDEHYWARRQLANIQKALNGKIHWESMYGALWSMGIDYQEKRLDKDVFDFIDHIPQVLENGGNVRIDLFAAELLKRYAQRAKVVLGPMKAEFTTISWDMERKKKTKIYLFKGFLSAPRTGPDKAMSVKPAGGIDLTAGKLPLSVILKPEGLKDLKVNHRPLDPSVASLPQDDKERLPQDDKGFKFNIDPSLLKRYQEAPGLVPVIIRMEPMKDLPLFLGLSVPQPEAQLAKG